MATKITGLRKQRKVTDLGNHFLMAIQRLKILGKRVFVATVNLTENYKDSDFGSHQSF